MGVTREVLRLTLILAVVLTGAGLGSGTAAATDLGDYLWDRRPLLLFSPTENDPRLVETLDRIDANRCDVIDRDMVIGVVVGEGRSTLDGHALDTAESQRLTDRYVIGGNDFTAVLIGKDGGQKLRVDDVPDLRTIFALIDGMPMRSREMAADASPC